MLEVDAKVLAPDELVRRVKDVLARTETDAIEFGQPSARVVSSEPALDATTLRVQGLQQSLTDLRPPQLPPPRGAVGAAKTFSKRAIRKATRWYVEPRWQTQTEFDTEATLYAAESNHALRQLDDRLTEVRAYGRRVADRTRIVAHETKDHGAAIASAREAVALAHVAIDQVHAQIAALEHVYADRNELSRVRDEVRHLLDRLGAASAAGANIDYVAFEERLRGSSDQLRASQHEYLRFIPGPEVLGLVADIGCGRGEMIDVLLDAGFEAIGVEPDQGMAAVCREKGFTIYAENGLTWLERQPNDSLKAVICLQVVEHLFTNELEALIRQTHSKLATGGVLIMETINPRSLYALSNHFLADTSHTRPIHPETLRFICEQAGFGQAYLVELSRHPLADVSEEIPAGSVRDAISVLLESVFGFQDYAIIANK